MSHNAMMIGWNRSIPGRERHSLEHFNEFLTYLGAQQKSGNISSFTPVLLEPHGGDFNGFVLVQGETTGLRKMIDDNAWQDHIARAQVNMQGFGIVRGAVGKELETRMQRWVKYL